MVSVHPKAGDGAQSNLMSDASKPWQSLARLPRGWGWKLEARSPAVVE